MNRTENSNKHQEETLKVKKLINLIYEFSSKCLEDFESFQNNFLLCLDPKTNFCNEIGEKTPQPVRDLINHLFKGENEIRSVRNFCEEYLLKKFIFSTDEVEIIKESINIVIEKGIAANRILTDKIDLKPLFSLKSKLN